MIFQTGDINNLLQGNYDNVIFDIVLRNGINTALEQAIGLQPTFMTVWIGNNDALGAVLSGTAIDGVTMTPVDIFAGLYNNAIGALATNTTADIVLINLPYPTEIPFATTLDPLVDIPGLGRWYLVADTGLLTDADLVTLAPATSSPQGYGLPGGAAAARQPQHLHRRTRGRPAPSRGRDDQRPDRRLQRHHRRRRRHLRLSGLRRQRDVRQDSPAARTCPSTVASA